MQALQVKDFTTGPEMTVLPKPPPPEDNSTVQIRVSAIGLHNLVKHRAAGRHPTGKQLPQIVGVDGVGVDVNTGDNV